MNVGQQGIWYGGQDCAAFDRIALWVCPSIPQASEREKLAVVHLKTIGLLDLAVSPAE
jgi:hypothetical protein